MQWLAAFYIQLPEDEKEKGIMKFAPHPPRDRDSLVSQLWDRHLRPWRDYQAETSDQLRNAELLSHLEKLSTGSAFSIDETELDLEDVEAISIERSVRRRKGSFWQIPKSLKQ